MGKTDCYQLTKTQQNMNPMHNAWNVLYFQQIINEWFFFFKLTPISNIFIQENVTKIIY